MTGTSAFELQLRRTEGTGPLYFINNKNQVNIENVEAHLVLIVEFEILLM